MTVTYSHFKDSIAINIIWSLKSSIDNYLSSFIPNKTMDARKSRSKKNITNDSETFLQPSCAHLTKSHTVSSSEHQYHGLSNVSCSNVNGHLKLVADMQSYPNGDIHQEANWPSLTPIATTFTTINQTTNNSLNASERVSHLNYITNKAAATISILTIYRFALYRI